MPSLKLYHRVTNSSNPFGWFISMTQMLSSPLFVTSIITKVLLSVTGQSNFLCSTRKSHRAGTLLRGKAHRTSRLAKHIYLYKHSLKYCLFCLLGLISKNFRFSSIYPCFLSSHAYNLSSRYSILLNSFIQLRLVWRISVTIRE